MLIAYGIAAIRGRNRAVRAPERHGGAFRMGLVTCLTSPKVGLFYVALLPQFVPAGAAVLPATLLLAAMQISLSLAWYFVLASAVGRARQAFARRRAQIQAATGALMIGFGLTVLADRR